MIKDEKQKCIINVRRNQLWKEKKKRNIDRYTNKLVGEPCFIHTGMSCEAASKYIFIYVTWTRV